MKAIDTTRFISFEGIDGAGKSTHIARLADALTANGREVVLTREPGGTPLAERLRDLVLHEAMTPITEALLMFAARRDHLDAVIVPALQAGKTVLCDRFTDATFAYQGAGRGFDWMALEQLESLVQRGSVHADSALGVPAICEPGLTLWFDLPPKVAAQRLANARVPDRFESQPVAFFEAVRGGYQRRLESAPRRMVRINADQAHEQVLEEVLAAMRSHGHLPEEH